MVIFSIFSGVAFPNGIVLNNFKIVFYSFNLSKIRNEIYPGSVSIAAACDAKAKKAKT